MFRVSEIVIEGTDRIQIVIFIAYGLQKSISIKMESSAKISKRIIIFASLNYYQLWRIRIS